MNITRIATRKHKRSGVLHNRKISRAIDRVMNSNYHTICCRVWLAMASSRRTGASRRFFLSINSRGVARPRDRLQRDLSALTPSPCQFRCSQCVEAGFNAQYTTFAPAVQLSTRYFSLNRRFIVRATRRRLPLLTPLQQNTFSYFCISLFFFFRCFIAKYTDS